MGKQSFVVVGLNVCIGIQGLNSLSQGKCRCSNFNSHINIWYSKPLLIFPFMVSLLEGNEDGRKHA